jgi:hypothetical protein
MLHPTHIGDSTLDTIEPITPYRVRNGMCLTDLLEVDTTDHDMTLRGFLDILYQHTRMLVQDIPFWIRVSVL